jgi:hypothetical protein
MEEIKKVKTESVSKRVDKPGLAARYVVGIRTVENWQEAEIILGQMEKHKWTFDVQECDLRLFEHSNRTNSPNDNK